MYNFLTLNLLNTTHENEISLSNILMTILNWIITEGVKLIIGVIILIISFKIINVLANKFQKTMMKNNKDKTITKVGYTIIRKGLKIIVFLLFLSIVGIDTAGIGSLIASLGVGIGLAVQGSLGNLAGGIIILLMRPFKIGDYIEAQGEGGTVEDIQIFYTYIITPNNKVVMIPNGSLANGNITNFSSKKIRRVDFDFSISYNEDFERVKEIILNVIGNIDNILNTPQPFVKIKTYESSSIKITTRVWTKTENYWTVYYDMMESIKISFDKFNIVIPYNQLDVNIKHK